ncbi:hypothetical protein [Burkholderia sp. PR2]|uniref:hypothetical protein n=1 Tax=Burkholderia sp. PR2 TaxID=3448078 RepID=UPI00402A8256
MSPLYADLPHLTEAEFDALVGAARARQHEGVRCISDRSVAMARAVLLEGARYITAARQYGGTLSTQALQAVHLLLRYRNPATAAPANSRCDRCASTYADLPQLTPPEFDTLVEAAQQEPGRGGRRISTHGIVMARAVLVDGKTYREAERALGLSHSVAARAVAALLRYRPDVPAQGETTMVVLDPFGRIPASAARGDA